MQTMRKARPVKAATPEGRFWQKVEKTKGGCWNWVAAKNNCGYGLTHFDGKRISAHRLSFQLANGVIPGGMQVLHRCDNRACVNPEHLFLGSNRDNMLDMLAKGRGVGQKKTHCPHGHEYTAENTMVTNGWRTCRICKRANTAQWKARQRGGAVMAGVSLRAANV